jgi:hypothetical protein
MSLILNGTDGLSDVDGTAGTPAIRGTDANTGIFFGSDIIGFSEGGVEAMRISSGGEVGIGSTETTYKLNIQNASASAFDGMQVAGDNASYNLVFQSGSVSASGTLFGVNKARGQFISSNNSPIVIGTLDAFPLVFGTNATERMRIISDGSILLGTTTAEGATGISFSNASDSAAYGKSMYMNSPYNGTRNAISFAYNSSGVGAIVTGTSSTSYNTSSDYRLKKDIAPMIGALDKVALLKPCTYKWKSDDSNGQGFIAHELQEVVPDCVTGEKDGMRTQQYEVSPAIPATFDEEGNELTPAVEAVMGEREVPDYQGIDTSFLVATLTSAIQELKAELDSIKAELATLKAQP